MTYRGKSEQELSRRSATAERKMKLAKVAHKEEAEIYWERAHNRAIFDLAVLNQIMWSHND